MKVHDDQSVIEKTGSTPLKYSPTVLVSTLLESWPIAPICCVGSDRAAAQRTEGHMLLFVAFPTEAGLTML